MGKWIAVLLPLVATTDFAPDGSAWNGLSEFCELARGMGMTVEASGDVDLDAVSPRTTTLMLFSPDAAPEPAALVHFLRRGGRVLIADDYGDAGPLLSALDIERTFTPAVVPAERYRDNPNLPIAHPASVGPLVHGVEHVVTNHPAYLRSRLPAVLSLSSALDAVAIAGEVNGGPQTGRFVALSDPSVLINNMLAFSGNVAFARNLLAWLGRPGGRLVIMRHDMVLRGGVDRRARPGLADLRREFNAFVAGLSKHPPSREVLRGLAVLGALGLGGCLVWLLRLPRRAPRGPFAVRR